MASRKKVQISVDLDAQAKGFENTINKAKTTLFKLRDGMSGKQFQEFSKSLDVMIKRLRAIRDTSADGFISQSGFEATRKKINDLKSDFSNWAKELQDLGINFEDFLPSDDDFKQITKDIENLTDKLKKLKKEISGRKANTETEEKMAAAAKSGAGKGAVDKIADARRKEIDAQLKEIKGKTGLSKASDEEVLKSYEEKSEKLKEARGTLRRLEGLGQGEKKAYTDQRIQARQTIENLRDVVPLLKTYVELQQELRNLDEAQEFYAGKEGRATQVTKAQKNLERKEKERASRIGEAQREAETELGGVKGIADEGSQALNGLKGKIDEGQAAFDKLDERAKNMGGLKSYFNSLVSATAIFMRLRQAVLQAFQDFQEIDSELNAISVVTGKSMDELWAGFGNLNKIAQEYGVTTKNVIEVQKLYYQQGRNAVEVTQLTGETLKFAKISGLDFANATDYMTAALNAYNIAAKDASTITDTYAALSAAAAVDSQEVAVAMSKVASMAAAGGSNFQDTSAYLSKVIETTRESAETAGTALKISA